ncbi:MAG TPA: molybdenum cofactor guanylyltransferase [Acidimicrobiales bacterium]|nr:molybdenum cofactor guanylyltransferase [Acidimicrobiales bacterium]
MPTPSSSVAAILLSGGASRRMGRDKSLLTIGGVTLAVRTGQLLTLVADTAIEVGPGVSGLPSFLESQRGEGPLVAVAAGAHALRELGHKGSALVVACDLPFLSEQLLRLIIEWDAPGSVVPVVKGRPQPLCAKWSPQDLRDAQDYVDRGVRSLQHLSNQSGVVYLDESDWGAVVTEEQFCDVDCPEDLVRLGLTSTLQV